MSNEHEQTADILDGAADVIERDGWCGGDGDGRDLTTGATCAGNAIFHLRDSGTEWGDAWIKAQEVFAAHLGMPDGGSRLSTIWTWNDAPERTKQEVLDALRSAAKDQRRLADGLDS